MAFFSFSAFAARFMFAPVSVKEERNWSITPMRMPLRRIRKTQSASPRSRQRVSKRGTGYWTEILARSAQSVTAIDINEEVLAIARSKPVDTSKTTFARADVYDLPAFLEKFDGGFAKFRWSHIPKQDCASFSKDFIAFSPPARVLFLLTIATWRQQHAHFPRR
jgi:SAM-dependent methyltransferase